MHVKFPSIEALRNVQFKLRRAFQGDDGKGNPVNPSVPLPTLTFRGTVKLHGTNAAAVLEVESGKMVYQSRDRQLSLSDDLFGFMNYMIERQDVVRRLALDALYTEESLRGRANPDYIAVFGEWAGASIQKTDIAVRGMDKIWAIVGVRLYYGDPNGELCETLWLDPDKIQNCNAHDHRIFNISEFGVHYLTLDMNDAARVEELIQAKTNEVDESCPIGRYFNKEGHGEGLVWQCVTPGFKVNEWHAKYPNGSSYDLTFKSKGERHEQSKKKEMDAVDPVYVEKVKTFIAYAVTEVRMQQGLSKLTAEVNQPLTPKIIGPFIKWVYEDVMKEEGDVLAANEIKELDIGKPLAEKAKTWFFKQLANAKQEV